ncbi:unnamed protein product [Paramecium primaurelia]|uniref:Transmembrane protein n=1 Tax=Paramecium primaurelia TaxID=5886 RepID=A0A8S1Q3Q2_PARPR|nr:unnamed protein product [Paramecium primaurelia]
MNSKFHSTLIMIAIYKAIFILFIPYHAYQFHFLQYFNQLDQKLKNNQYNILYKLFCWCNFEQMLIEIYNQKLMINQIFVDCQLCLQ